MSWLLVLLVIILSFVITGAYRQIAIKKAILDIPNYRSSHSTPTPRGGGIAIVVSFYLALTFLFVNKHIEADIFYALLVGLILVIVGIIDDIYQLPASLRFVTQFVVAGFALYLLGGLQKLNLGFYTIEATIFLSILAAVGIVWFINLFNFIDGIDGYASMEAIFFGIAAYVLTNSFIVMLLAMATIGFIPWNWQKAKIFMGDVGSTMLGFCIVILGIYYQNSDQLSLISWLMLTSLFWYDATVTLFRRWRNKEKLSEAHRKHAYQRAVQSGLSHQQTSLWGLFLNLIGFALVWVAQFSVEFLLGFFVLQMLILFLFLQRVDKRKAFE